MLIRSVVSICVEVVIVANVGMASGQNYPNKLIRIMTTEPGAGLDLMARVIAQGISGTLGQPVIVENHPANLLAEVAAKAAPDGYVIATASGAFWLTPLLQKTSYDVIRDFSPITLTGTYP